MKQSFQIIADLKKCKSPQNYFFNLNDIKKEAGNIIKKSGFKIINFCGHKFKNSGVSLVFLVSESHVAIHTWPEHGSVNIDIFFCNYSKNNAKKGEVALKMFRDVFQSGNVAKKLIKRTY